MKIKKKNMYKNYVRFNILFIFKMSFFRKLCLYLKLLFILLYYEFLGKPNIKNFLWLKRRIHEVENDIHDIICNFNFYLLEKINKTWKLLIEENSIQDHKVSERMLQDKDSINFFDVLEALHGKDFENVFGLTRWPATDFQKTAATIMEDRELRGQRELVNSYPIYEYGPPSIWRGKNVLAKKGFIHWPSGYGRSITCLFRIQKLFSSRCVFEKADRKQVKKLLSRFNIFNVTCISVLLL